MRDALHAVASLYSARVERLLLVACIMHVCAGLVLAALARGQDTTIELSTATIADLNAAFEAEALDAEQLVTHCLDRIEAYDQAGPRLNAVLAVNPRAVERAQALDAERAADGPRSPLHGIPVVLKDNVDTADMPTTAGSFMLAESLPPDDAFLVQTLRDAGAIILAKLNMSEFASGGPLSSLGGPIRNPHDPERTPAGSSGGTGAAIAAAYAPLGIGTDTGGSVRAPSSANGIVGLKPTHGLLSRDGIVPLALSFDTAGPMARHVHDIAVALNVMARVDPADDATQKAADHVGQDYTQFLDADALDGARIGVARDFMGSDPEVDWVVEAALETMRLAGATVVDVGVPSWVLEARGALYRTIRYREFRAQIADYLATLGPDYPKTLADLVDRSLTVTAPRENDVRPNPSRWSLMRHEVESGELTDRDYRAVRDHGLPLLRGVVENVLTADSLDALVYPTLPVRPERADADPDDGEVSAGSGRSAVTLANLTGFPDLIVPAGFTGRGLPVTLSFLGPAFSEPRLLALGYAFEQRTQAHRLPAYTPLLPGDTLTY